MTFIQCILFGQYDHLQSSLIGVRGQKTVTKNRESECVMERSLDEKPGDLAPNWVSGDLASASGSATW